MRKLFLWACLTLGMALAGERAALAQRIVISDLASAPELRDEAGALSLLMQSQFRPTTRALIGRGALAQAMDAIGVPTPREALVVDPAFVAPLLDKLTADRLIIGTLTRTGDRLRVVGQVLGPDGGKIADYEASGPPGELSDLA